MIKTKLIKLLADSKKYIAYNIFWQWAALISQIIIVYIIANIIAKLPAPRTPIRAARLRKPPTISLGKPCISSSPGSIWN